jgi:hypothetical protein
MMSSVLLRASWCLVCRTSCAQLTMTVSASCGAMILDLNLWSTRIFESLLNERCALRSPSGCWVLMWFAYSLEHSLVGNTDVSLRCKQEWKCRYLVWRLFLWWLCIPFLWFEDKIESCNSLEWGFISDFRSESSWKTEQIEHLCVLCFVLSQSGLQGEAPAKGRRVIKGWTCSCTCWFLGSIVRVMRYHYCHSLGQGSRMDWHLRFPKLQS